MTDLTPDVPGDLTVGSYVAGYRIDARIGSGGMAVVFRAHDQRLDRQVALKVLSPALAADEAFRQRFIRESRAAAAVDDPHIIPVFEAGEAHGVLFIAMRLVRGGDVRSLLDRTGPLPPGRTAEIVAQVAGALDAAHARGLVHRDVKPANMLLDARPSPGRPDHVYLSDFGLSKAALAATGLTAAGQFLGTLDYIAPEQIEGRPVDGRADQYALACAAYELLSGEPPFSREDSVSVMYAQLHTPPPALRRRRPDLPADVDVVLAKALAKAPADRFSSCGSFAAALRQVLGLAGAAARPSRAHPATEIARPVPSGPGDTQQAGSPSPTAPVDRGGSGRPARPWWRSPFPVAGLSVVVLLAAGGAYALAGHNHSAANAAVLPACSVSTASAKTFTTVRTAGVTLSGGPFGVTTTRDGKYSFVSVGNAIDMLSDNRSLAPTLVRTFFAGNAGKGITITPDGKFLLAAAGSGAVVISVAEAENGAADPVVGTLASKHGTGAVEVLVSADNRFAFVTLQGSRAMAVFNLHQALTDSFPATDFVGDVPLGDQPVGLASDGTWLYVTNLGGTVNVVNVAKAEAKPATSVVSTARAGCGPARAVLSRHGQVLWVTARQSDAVLAFSTAKLRSDPTHALIAKVMVGEVPLGETLVAHGAKIVVADSNLFGLKGAQANLAVVDTAKALAGRPALLGYVQTGLLPRQFAVEPGGRTLLVTDQNSHQVQALRIADLP